MSIDDDTRTQVDPIYSPRAFGFSEELQPEASPVNTYVRPATPAPSPLHGLAASLSGFSQDLAGFMRNQQQTQDSRDKALAQAAAYKANGAGYADAVSQGLVSPANSPVFQKAYKEAQGAILGKRLAAGAVDAYQQWPDRNSQDPADFDKFLGNYIKQNLTTNDPDVLAGAMPYVSSTSDTLINANEKERSQQLYDNSIKTHIASSSMTVDNAMDVALTKSTGVDYDQLWAGLMADRDHALASGVRADDYDKQMVGMIHSKALEYLDPGILGLLKNKVPGQTYSYDDADGSKGTQETLTTMEARQAEIERLKAQQDAANNKTELNTITGKVITQLAQNPNAVIDPQDIARAQQLGDPAFPVHVRDWAKTLASPVPTPEDQSTILALQKQVMSGAPLTAITSEIGTEITDPHTLSSLYDLYNTVNAKGMDAVLRNPTVKQGLTYLRQSFVSTDVFTAGGDTPDGIQAETDFTMAMASWYRQNPGASYTDIAAEATKVLKDMSSTIQTPGTAKPYIRPDAITQDIGQSPKLADVEPPALTPDASQFERLATGLKVAGGASDPWGGNRSPQLGQLPQDQQDKINERAQNLGVDPQVIVNSIYTHLHGQPGGYRPMQQQQPSTAAPTPNSSGAGSSLPDNESDIVRDDNGGVWDAQTGVNLIAPNKPQSLLDMLSGGWGGSDFGENDYAEPTRPPSSPALDAINAATTGGEPIGGSRSWRNNNPGNMEYNDFTKAHGATGRDGRFAIFPDAATGRAAMGARLFTDRLYASKTIKGAIEAWAPASDGNNTAAYLSSVVKAVGVPAHTLLADLNPTQRQALLDAMTKQEGWTPGTQQQQPNGLKPDADAGPNTVTPLQGITGITGAAPASIKQAVATVERDPGILEQPKIDDESATTGRYFDFGQMTNPHGLVIHHTGGDGDWQSVVQTYRERGLPAHFVIDRDGVIHQILGLTQKGQHILPANDGSDLNNSNAWGVEIIAKDDSDVTPQEIVAAMQLARYLHGHGLDYNDVRGHGTVNRGHKELTEGASVVSAIQTLNQAAGGEQV